MNAEQGLLTPAFLTQQNGSVAWVVGKSSSREHGAGGCYSIPIKHRISLSSQLCLLIPVHDGARERNLGGCLFLRERRYANDLNVNLMFYSSWLKW